MPTYKTLGGLMNAIGKKVETSLKSDVAQQMIEQQKQSDETQFYARSSGNFSERSLINSVASEYKKQDDDMIVSVFHDVTKMSSKYPSWNPESSINGNDNRPYIVKWLEEGTTSRLHSHEAFGFVQHSRDAIYGNVTNWLIQSLMSRGLKISK